MAATASLRDFSVDQLAALALGSHGGGPGQSPIGASSPADDAPEQSQSSASLQQPHQQQPSTLSLDDDASLPGANSPDSDTPEQPELAACSLDGDAPEAEQREATRSARHRRARAYAADRAAGWRTPAKVAQHRLRGQRATERRRGRAAARVHKMAHTSESDDGADDAQSEQQPFVSALDATSLSEQRPGASVLDASPLSGTALIASSLSEQRPGVSALDASPLSGTALDASSPKGTALDVSPPDTISLDGGMSSLSEQQPGASTLDDATLRGQAMALFALGLDSMGHQELLDTVAHLFTAAQERLGLGNMPPPLRYDVPALAPPPEAKPQLASPHPVGSPLLSAPTSPPQHPPPPPRPSHPTRHSPPPSAPTSPPQRPSPPPGQSNPTWHPSPRKPPPPRSCRGRDAPTGAPRGTPPCKSHSRGLADAASSRRTTRNRAARARRSSRRVIRLAGDTVSDGLALRSS